MIPVTILISRQKQHTPSRSEWRDIVNKMIKHSTDSSAELSFDDLGKPYIDHPDIAISYSHTKDTLIVAFAHSGANIGVDAENTSRMNDISELRDTAFSKEERYPAKSDLISNWCLKEAAVKMYGRGFHDYDPADIAISAENALFNARVHNREIIKGHFKIIHEEQLVVAICSDKKFSPHIKYWSEISGAGVKHVA